MPRTSPAALLLALSLVAWPTWGHVTPNVQLVKKGELVRDSLPGATRFFERSIVLDAPSRTALEKRTGWSPTREDTRVYVGRRKDGSLVGMVGFLWMPSQHGPVGVGVAFDARGVILRVAVTDVGSEPLEWIRPLLGPGGIGQLAGLAPDEKPEAGKIAPAVKGRMSRYYARVIADGVARLQDLAAILAPTKP